MLINIYIGDGNKQCCKRESRTTIKAACKILKNEHRLPWTTLNNAPSIKGLDILYLEMKLW